jgi:hypothetical protein
MPDILIHRCTLRIVRRSGWSWGPHSQRLLQAAVKALPELLAARLAALWLTDAEREISAPVQLTVRLQMSELLALVSPPAGQAAIATSEITQALNTRIEAALRTALAREPLEPVSMTSEGNLTPSSAVNEETPNEPAAAMDGSVPRLLLRWREQGLLGERLADFPLAVLESWHRYLLNNAKTPSLDPQRAPLEEIDALIAGAARSVTSVLLDRSTLLRWRIALTVEAMARFDLSPKDLGLRATLQRWFPLEDSEQQTPAIAASHDGNPESIIGEPTAPYSSVAATPQAIAHRQPPLSRHTLRITELHAPSALPFLLLNPLAQTGWLELLGALMEAAELSIDAHLLAAALAYKVSPPPERGWRRNPTAIKTAQAFAATPEPVDEAALVDFAGRAAPHLAPLDALIADSLSRGHDPRQPLLTQRAGSGWALFDCEGVFPIARVDAPEKLIPLIERLSASVILIPRTSAEPELMRMLEAANVGFVTDAAPGRRDNWRRLQTLAGERWWTNHHTAAGEIIRAARALEPVAADGELLWEELAVKRLAAPLATAAAFERSLALAAGVALGTIAWELWRKREPVAPHLALERFSDLDALVCYGERAVTVRLPLGRRFQDLNEHGFLNDVSGVPWLRGRTLRFSGS